MAVEDRSLTLATLEPYSRGVVDAVDLVRIAASSRPDQDERAHLGQFLTPPSVARLMASFVEARSQAVRILEPGAGVGSLIAATVESLCARSERPAEIQVTAFEIDPYLIAHLRDALDLCRVFAKAAGVRFTSEVLVQDFLATAAERFGSDLFSRSSETPFDVVVTNPPYRKIRTNSPHREWVRRIGLETTNLYAAFVGASLSFLGDRGELVAITPRSFCNGTYFRPFRRFLLDRAVFTHVHLFESRKEAFRDDAVLQENVIFRVVRGGQQGAVRISTSNGGKPIGARTVPYQQLVRPADPEAFIYLITDQVDRRASEARTRLHGSLAKLGVNVSTGRVVDFRTKENLRQMPEPGAVPLLYPGHLRPGGITWPVTGRKPNAIALNENTLDLLVPNDHYVLVKRFTAKEERRRVVATVVDPSELPTALVGIENHLNYYHRNGRGLDPEFARGLAAFLNSTLLDVLFRQFSGHTQVNATDLRTLPYPTEPQLRTLGEAVGRAPVTTAAIDSLLDEVILGMANGHDSPSRAKRRIGEALEILRSIGVPRQQQNERSALTLLALLGIDPSTPWAEATSSPLGIHSMLGFFSVKHGVRYAENTRETIRRQSLHQFLQAGIAVVNPDEPTRRTNSPKTVYGISEDALQLARAFGLDSWQREVAEYLSKTASLADRYKRSRRITMVPVKVGKDREIALSPGGHSILVKAILEEFAPRFVPGGIVLYVGDTRKKFAYFDEGAVRELWLEIEPHGKIPDVMIFDPTRNWLILIEAVTSHGPIDRKRHIELEDLFGAARAGLVYVTTFPSRAAMTRYLGSISWETEVWVADEPDHLMHFDGERFLGPYESRNEADAASTRGGEGA